MPKLQFLLWFGALLISLSACSDEYPAGVVERHHVHAPGLENTLTNESAQRSVAVYLPPAYYDAPQRRFAVLYLLHGINDTETVWLQPWDSGHAWRTIPDIMDRGIATGVLADMIIVMPDMRSRAGGSFYLNSSATGRWHDFLVDDLVTWTDRTFRTLPDAASRGIAGHSMGGYGALVTGARHPEIYSLVYAISPGAIDWGADLTAANPAFRTLLDATGWADVDTQYEAAITAAAQAFSPNPQQPPLYIDLPFEAGPDGNLIPALPAFEHWDRLLAMGQTEQHRDNLARLRGLRFDAGRNDEYSHIPLTARRLSQRLQTWGIDHGFEEYDGDHRNRLWGKTGRLHGEVLVWFSSLLKHDTESDAP